MPLPPFYCTAPQPHLQFCGGGPSPSSWDPPAYSAHAAPAHDPAAAACPALAPVPGNAPAPAPSVAVAPSAPKEGLPSAASSEVPGPADSAGPLAPNPGPVAGPTRAAGHARPRSQERRSAPPQQCAPAHGGCVPGHYCSRPHPAAPCPPRHSHTCQFSQHRSLRGDCPKQIVPLLGPCTETSQTACPSCSPFACCDSEMLGTGSHWARH
mmetsp:Transcript_1018/g.1885  ORF Transcript_1018/g.1885 Transcript_1018/m.1885 type:complete len:210 (+) Transcript_1018:1675-2304(+)